MNDLELDALTIQLSNSSSKEIKDNLLHGRYHPEEVPYIEGYLPYKIEEERNKPVKMFHRRKALDGKQFKAYEVSALESKGWVDSPSKIKKDARDKIADSIKTIFAFWCKEYKWILGFILSAIALYLAYLKITTLNN